MTPSQSYLVTVHNRLHPIFAEQDLPDLGKTPPLTDPSVYTSLEIVLDKNTGKVVRMGVTKPSGFPSFDRQALASVERAAPFGKAPDVIASPDGNVYLHWEFHRNPVDACTTRNARVFIANEAPRSPDPAPQKSTTP
jgi:TonB family protein